MTAEQKSGFHVQQNSWAPPLEWLQESEAQLQQATPEELAAAERLYRAYQVPTHGRSAVSGAELPTFSACTPLVRAGWLAVARAARGPQEEPHLIRSSSAAGATPEAPQGS